MSTRYASSRPDLLPDLLRHAAATQLRVIDGRNHRPALRPRLADPLHLAAHVLFDLGKDLPAIGDLRLELLLGGPNGRGKITDEEAHENLPAWPA
jgi:hypothetical protein